MFRGTVPFTLHAALELITATALIGLPFALGLSFDATLTAAVIGVALFGLAVSATASEGRGTLPISAHAAYDAAIGLVLVVSALIFGATGEAAALIFLLAAGAAQLLLNSVTRYSPASS
jgi:hypothetical protein